MKFTISKGVNLLGKLTVNSSDPLRLGRSKCIRNIYFINIDVREIVLCIHAKITTARIDALYGHGGNSHPVLSGPAIARHFLMTEM